MLRNSIKSTVQKFGAHIEIARPAWILEAKAGARNENDRRIFRSQMEKVCMTLSARATANVRRSAPKFRDTSAAGPQRSSRRRAVSTPRIRSGLSKCVALFLISLFIPWLWTIGPVVISPYRLVLIITVLPCLAIWIRGKAGGIFFADIMILFFSFWCVVSLAAVHDIDTAVQSGGIIFIETVGAYMLGRCFIRSAEQFYGAVRLLFWTVAMLLPFALVEAILNWNVALSLFSNFFPTHVLAYNVPRWGMRRVQTVFEHPILFGASCGAILALVHLVLGYDRPPLRRWSGSAVVLVTALLSLSAGPMTALFAQSGLMGWNWLLGRYERRWMILWGLILAIYVLISIASNQTVPEFYLTHFSFDQGSAFYRILIWNFGSASALNHPFFGVGFNRWDRPDWMPGSIDMFWLYYAVLFGIPAGLLMMLSFLSMVATVSFKTGLDTRLLQYRTAYLTVMTGYFLVGWTVHFWNATYVLFLFLLGSGSWLLDAGPNPSASGLLTKGIGRSLRRDPISKATAQPAPSSEQRSHAPQDFRVTGDTA